MEEMDMEILRGLLAQRVAYAVNDVCTERNFVGGVDVYVTVGTPTCYIDDGGMLHTGRLVSVMVDFSGREDDDDED